MIGLLVPSATSRVVRYVVDLIKDEPPPQEGATNAAPKARAPRSQSVPRAKTGLTDAARYARTISERAMARKLADKVPAKVPHEPRHDRMNLPPRPADAPSGRAFVKSIARLSPTARDQAILSEVRRGNVPTFMRKLRTIEVSAKGRDGALHTAKVRVMPDYLAVGSDNDYVRVPMTPQTAQKIADTLNMSLPTRKLVDDIHAQAAVRVAPQAYGRRRESTDTFEKHSRRIDEQLPGPSQGELTSGHKKDVVLSSRLVGRDKKVAIYGWHQENGEAIQPLSTVHHSGYVDYSHGTRLVGATVLVDGVERPIEDVLRDPDLAPLLSDEGVLTQTRIRG